jgi:hypothetical protein
MSMSRFPSAAWPAARALGGGAMALLLGAAPGQAAIITFATAPTGTFSGPVTEDGFTYRTESGALFVDTLGDPTGHDMEGSSGSGGGVLSITDGGDFTYSGLDFAAYDSAGSSSGTQTLTVSGFLNGVLAGTDRYTLTSTNGANPTYSNWSAETASVLAGQRIDDLLITLDAGSAPAFYYAAIDNIALTPASAVPEPAAAALVGVGLLALGWARHGGRDRLPRR